MAVAFFRLSNGHLNLPVVHSVPAVYFPRGFCVRCLHTLYERTNMLKQCDAKILFYFFCKCVVYMSAK